MEKLSNPAFDLSISLNNICNVEPNGVVGFANISKDVRNIELLKISYYVHMGCINVASFVLDNGAAGGFGAAGTEAVPAPRNMTKIHQIYQSCI